MCIICIKNSSFRHIWKHMMALEILGVTYVVADSQQVGLWNVTWLSIVMKGTVSSKGMLCICGRMSECLLQVIEWLIELRNGSTDFSHTSTSICMHYMTACFMSAFIAFHWALYYQPYLWLVTVLCLGGCGLHSQQSLSWTLQFPFLCSP